MGFEVFVAKAVLGEIEEREWTYVRKDGSTFPVMLSISALRNECGEISGFVIMVVIIQKTLVIQLDLRSQDIYD